MVCRDKGITNTATLYENIKSLSDKGIIPEQLKSIALKLKDLRNIGAHANLGELTENEIPILEAMINAILEYVYAAPLLIEKVEERIEALKLKK